MTVIFSNLKITLVFIFFGFFQIFACPDGCRCFSNKIVDCSNLELEHFPKGLHQFVERLDFSSNSFSKIPEEIQDLRHLKFLNFSNNQIRSLEKNSLAGLKKLQVLDLSKNDLAQVSVETFEENLRLRYLNLDYKLSDVPAMPAQVLVVVSRGHLTLNDESGTVFVSGNSSRNQHSSSESDVSSTLRLKRDSASDNNDLRMPDSAGSSLIILLLILIAAILIGGTVLQVRAKRKRNVEEAAKRAKMAEQPKNLQQQVPGIDGQPPEELSLEKFLKQELNFGNRLLFPYPPTAPMHFRVNLT